jgi:DUF1680 family protein
MAQEIRPMRRAWMAGWLALGAAGALADEGTPRVRLQGVPFSEVRVKDTFWAPRQEVNRTASIPVNLEMLEKAGNLPNLRLAAAGAREGYTGPVFMDSDVYKALEAASYALATHPDPGLAARLDAIIDVLAKAQQPDGYLNSYYTVKEPGRRWTNLRDNHELYCAGHLFEAAVAHFRATGKTNFLEVATKLADHIDSVFGPGKRMGYPGHPEIELALVKLADVTGERRYFELARFFVENRGRHYFATEHRTPEDRYDGTYWQDDVPIREHRNIKGHAVRAAYLMSGATDVAAATGDAGLLAMLDRVWKNTARRNMYVTGGIGPSAHNEGFTEDYDLPNRSAYQETCASVALAQWNHRLALLYGDAKYADVMERSLYNGVVAGVSLDGTKFFYVNPLESGGGHHRSPWFGCACCPPNAARTIASIGGYAYATGKDALHVNLYIQGSVEAKVGETPVALDVATAYPWAGDVAMTVRPASPSRFALRLRVPGWARGAALKVNGTSVEAPPVERGYAVLDREWKAGDRVELALPMPVERVVAHPKVAADAGRVALQRGPIVYCVEGADNGKGLDGAFLSWDAPVTAEPRTDLLGGVVVLKADAARLDGAPDWSGTLYQAAPPVQAVPLVAIPYAVWDNRTPGPMAVWLPTAPEFPKTAGMETAATVRMSFANDNCQPEGIRDGVEPRRSGEQPERLAHWWPHQGGEEWISYEWPTARAVAGCRVYWFDDTGRGACRLPEAWRVEYRDGDRWKPVPGAPTYEVAADRWCEVRFPAVTTDALRLVVRMQPKWAAGVHEWTITPSED